MSLLALAAAVACVATGTEGGDSVLRPTPTFRCPWLGTSLAGRVAALLRTPAADLTKVRLERLLDLPPLPTQFDDPRSLNTAAQLTTSDGWSIRVDTSETFWPSKGRPEFAGSLFPRRLHPSRHGEVRLSLFLATPPGRAAPGCPTAEDLEALFARAGWRFEHLPPAADSGMIIPAYRRSRTVSATFLDYAAGETGRCMWVLHVLRET